MSAASIWSYPKHDDASRVSLVYWDGDRFTTVKDGIETVGGIMHHLARRSGCADKVHKVGCVQPR